MKENLTVGVCQELLSPLEFLSNAIRRRISAHQDCREAPRDAREDTQRWRSLLGKG